MATLLKAALRQFEPNPNRPDNFRLLTDISRVRQNVDPNYLNFDLRQLPAGQFGSAYHSHRFAEELFMILSGSATLRTPEGLEVVNPGDIIFFETGDGGAHQLYNHTDELCVYLDIRTFIGYDVCDYPDSDKIYLIPSGEIFDKSNQPDYYDGENDIREKWRILAADMKNKPASRHK